MKKRVALKTKEKRITKKPTENTAVDSLYKIRNDQLEKEIAELKVELSRSLFIKEYIDIDIGDPAPSDKEKRKEYVSSVAGIHVLILRKKLLQMISTSRALLEKQENDRDYDLAVKGAIFGLWEIIRWGDLMVGEDKENTSTPDETKK